MYSEYHEQYTEVSRVETFKNMEANATVEYHGSTVTQRLSTRFLFKPWHVLHIGESPDEYGGLILISTP